jgi:hypothetical protein
MNANDARLLRLHPKDNVLTVIRPLEAGTRRSPAFSRLETFPPRRAFFCWMWCPMAGHQEFSLVYKSFEPLGPACMP